MKAYLIDAENNAIDSTDVDSMDDIIKLVGFDTIISDEVGNSGDRLFFDEDCFLRGSSGRFQIDSVIPVSGKAVLMGASDDGSRLSDVSVDLDDLNKRIKYL